MPLPQPNENEKRNDFINKCMSDETMIQEYKNESQRFAVCNTEFSKNKNQKNEESNSDQSKTSHQN